MAVNVYLKIYSNDGSTLLFTSSDYTSTSDTGLVTSTGFEFTSTAGKETYTYSGGLKFLGFALSANANEPSYAVGETISPLGGGINTLYIVESLEGTTWYVPSGWTATAGYGKFSISCSYGDVSGSNFYIGFHDTEGLGAVFPTANRVGIYDSYGLPVVSLTPSTELVIIFTGGADSSKPELIQWLTTYGTQLKVDDLTNTTWKIYANGGSEEPDPRSEDLILNGVITFPDGEQYSFTNIEFADDYKAAFYNGNNHVFSYDSLGNSFVNTSYDDAPEGDYFINCQGGTDIKNPALIAWLSKYGELKVEEEGEAPPDDLTGYTVTLPSSLLMFENVVYVEGDINFNYSEGSSSVGFTALGYGNPLYAISYIADGYSSFNGEFYIKPDLDLYYADALYGTAVSMTFTGGDTTNSSLIQWLVDNDAIFTKEDEEEDKTPILTYDLSQLNLPVGTHLITVIAKADGYADSAPSNVVEYVVKESVPTDLTGYTVTVPENWGVDSGYGEFDIDAKQIFDGGSYQFISIVLGDIENDVIFLVKNLTGLGKILDDTSVPIVFEIFGGNDVSNPALIQWFVDNKATFKKTSTIPTLISFTIKGTTYQAEEGMTWEQWIASDYNIGGFKIIGNFIKLNDTDIDYVLDPSTTMRVNITDKIIANYSYYYTTHGGGSN